MGNMTMKPLFAAALAAAALASALPAPALAAAKVPTKVGQCVSTTIKEKFSRLEGVPDRGKTYSALDLRTKGKWELPDAEHMCGGA
jgi:hypothetical protein